MNQLMTAPARVLKRITTEELLVWTYMRQKADVVMEHGVGLHRIERAIDAGIERSMTTDSAQMVANTLMGAGGYSGAAYELHPDAETVHEHVRRLRVDMRTLIVECARTGLRPDWAEGKRLRVVPILRPADGLPSVVWDKHGNNPLYCRVTVEGAEIAGKRERFTMWWDALSELTLALMNDSLLMSHEITALGVEREPWKSAENTKASPQALTRTIEAWYTRQN